MSSTPPPLGGSWREWAERLNNFIARTKNKLDFKLTGESASENGIMLWDETKKHMVLSVDGEFLPIPYGENSYGFFSSTVNQTALSSDTATLTTWNTTQQSHNVAIDATYSDRINFSRHGIYKIIFTAQVSSSSGAALTFHFWKRVNGVDSDAISMIQTISSNTQTAICTRSGIFEVEAGDYIQLMWAVTNTSGMLIATSATAFAPASPSVTVSVQEVYVQ